MEGVEVRGEQEYVCVLKEAEPCFPTGFLPYPLGERA